MLLSLGFWMSIGRLPALSWSRRSNLRLAAVVAIVGTVAAGCVGAGDRIWGAQTVALRLVDRRPSVVIYMCPGGKPITQISVTTHNIQADVDHVIWKLARTPADPAATEHVDTVTIGQPAAGFETVTALVDALPTASLDINVSRDHPEGGFTFKAADLTESSLRVERSWFGGRRSVDMNKFMSVNRKNC